MILRRRLRRSCKFGDAGDGAMVSCANLCYRAGKVSVHDAAKAGFEEYKREHGDAEKQSAK